MELQWVWLLEPRQRIGEFPHPWEDAFMLSKKSPILFVTAFTVVLGFLTTATPAFAARTEQVWHSFTRGAAVAARVTAALRDTGSLLFGGNGTTATELRLSPQRSSTSSEHKMHDSPS